MTKQENDILKQGCISLSKYRKNFPSTKGFLFLNVEDLNDCILITPTQYKTQILDGMQILFDKRAKIFEVSEYQAGSKQTELHIYTETKSFKKALKSLLKGNKRTPKKIWD